MKDQKPLINRDALLEKFPGKGGWTYTTTPEILPNTKNPFGWVQIRGFIDDFEIKQYKLMPMGNGQLFLPVKAEIRKKIKKQAGDTVKLVIYLDESEVEIPQEILACFETEPSKIYQTFLSFSEGERKAYIDWIYAAKTDETKIQRIANMMERLQQKLRLQD